MLRPIAQLRWFFPEGTIYDTGTSASHLIFVALEKMGCNPIMMVGQDLAFDRFTERSHATGIPQLLYDVGQKQRATSLKKVKENNKSEMLVPGNNGEPILTMNWWNSFRHTLNTLIRHTEADCYNVIPKDYGAKIENAKIIDPSEALALLPSTATEIVTKMRRTLMETHQQKTHAEYLDHFKERTNRALSYLLEYQQVALEMLDAISLFRQRYNPKYFSEDTFKPFLERVELIAEDLFKDEDNFYEAFFMAQVQTKTFAIAQKSEGLLASNVDPKLRIEYQLEWAVEWFLTTYTWASRMEQFIKRRYSGDINA